VSESLGTQQLTLCSEEGERGDERIAEERVKKESHGRSASTLFWGGGQRFWGGGSQSSPVRPSYAGSIKVRFLN
jgi:hypothetical protein